VSSTRYAVTSYGTLGFNPDTVRAISCASVFPVEDDRSGISGQVPRHTAELDNGLDPLLYQEIEDLIGTGEVIDGRAVLLPVDTDVLVEQPMLTNAGQPEVLYSVDEVGPECLTPTAVFS
jgi:hypothetical protein